MTDLKGQTLSELEGLVTSWGMERYRARQIMKWIYQKGVDHFQEMTDLPKRLREKLSKVAFVSRLEPVKILISEDETRKYLFHLSDGNLVEAVFIPEERRATACLSVQVGCPLACRFCLTGQMGYIRDLKASEIIDQLCGIYRDLNGRRRISNVVFMGEGEPLINLDETLKAIEILTSEFAFNLAPRRITVSTVGIVPGIMRLAEESRVNLAVSLHATTEEVRRRLLPVGRRYPLRAVIDACRRYPVPQRRRITFEYLLLKGINDSLEDAHRLARLLKGIKCKVNLFPYNEYPGGLFKRPEDEVVEKFQQVLISHNMTATVRRSRGRDILGACGQLGSQRRLMCQRG